MRGLTSRQPPQDTILARSFLLFGAGASYEAYVPTANQFVSEIEKYIAEMRPATTSDALLKALDDAKTNVKSHATIDANTSVALEPFFEALDDSLDFHFRRQPLRELAAANLTPSRSIERLHYETKRVIQLRCAVTDPTRTEHLEPLLRHVAGYESYPIVSFNYDSVVETACNSAGLRFAEKVLNEDTRGCDIELVKVHGSVTWLQGRHGKLSRSPGYNNAILNRSGALRTPILETPLIYPSRRKMPMQAPFLKNAVRFQELLADTRYNSIVAVGYSFPDSHVRSWLAEAMRARPELGLYVVDPNPGPALENLVKNLPDVSWKNRLKVISQGFNTTIKGDFETSLKNASGFGDYFPPPRKTPTRKSSALQFGERIAGLAASPDGGSLFASGTTESGNLYHVDLNEPETRRPQLWATRLKNPRGIAVTASGELLVVQNRLLHSKSWAGIGAGTIVKISNANAQRHTLTRFSLSELRRLFAAFRRDTPSSELWHKFPSLLRWPTDVVIRNDGTIFVTEARALTQLVAEGQQPKRVHEGELLFNLQGLAVANDDALIGLEHGVSQDFSWGRVARYGFEPNRLFVTHSAEIDGDAALHGICYVGGWNKIIITKAWAWPFGALIVLDYPYLNNRRFVDGFDMPGKITYIPKRDIIAVSTLAGLEFISLSAFKEAVYKKSRAA